MDTRLTPTEKASPTLEDACVIQIGGTLADWVGMADWMALAARLGARRPTVIVPTGGPFVDTVRDAEDMWRLQPGIVRRMTLLAMDSFALLLHGIHPEIGTAAGPVEMKANAAAGRASVWLPSSLAAARRELAEDWDATSDSLAAWLAVEIGAERLILVKAGTCPCHSVEDLGADTAAMVRDGVLSPGFPVWRRRFGGAVWCVERERVEDVAAALERGGGFGCPLAATPLLGAAAPER
ncbi:uridylate kinase [Skermanella mucosa]|uniref:uridylate kinase n=1 Tax=Skermanella mucosa TaxID=1789672 RepID=UPI00192C25EE|nr:uridylate kinase [Skermanella mucosa]UEM20635.1 uridylate kinase [Skermanella mucosa]